ncbi:MAG TPA: DUF3047 domain-containing protein [Casimicrobiaceae bacterium]
MLPLAATLALGLGQAARVEAQAAAALTQLPRFSQMKPGGALAPWEPVTIVFGKRSTRYDLVDDHGTVVLHAIADNAASGLGHAAQFELRDAPVIAWRWKIAALIAEADSYKAGREDAPARIVLEFDGDRKKLTLLERGIYRVAEEVAGRELPYATLMYIWSNRVPVGTLIANPRTRRVQMIVASSGPAGVGAWQSLARDVRADFRRAFGEEPGRLLAVGVLTDTDNTDGHAEAWYGDIVFQPAPQ